jgi:hypothetical protein
VSAIDDTIARLRDMPDRVKELAPAVGEAVLAAAKAELAAGHGLGGDAWEPTKKGKRPLQGAPDALTLKVVGTVILLGLSGAKWFYKFHQAGAGALPARKVFPESGVPAALMNVARRTVREQLERR